METDETTSDDVIGYAAEAVMFLLCLAAVVLA